MTAFFFFNGRMNVISIRNLILGKEETLGVEDWAVGTPMQRHCNIMGREN